MGLYKPFVLGLKRLLMTPTSSFKLVLTLVLLGCTTQSCVKDAIDLEHDDIQSSKIDDNIPYGEALILGKQLENPFSVDNMEERALNTIQRTERQATSIPSQIRINTTTTQKIVVGHVNSLATPSNN